MKTIKLYILMNNYVADTMAIVLYLEKRKLPAQIKLIFNNAVEGKINIYISAISLMEIGYLSEKQRIEIQLSSVTEFAKANDNFFLQSLDTEIVAEAFKIKTIPELHDRLIAATAIHLKATLITNDPLIQLSQSVNTVW